MFVRKIVGIQPRQNTLLLIFLLSLGLTLPCHAPNELLDTLVFDLNNPGSTARVLTSLFVTPFSFQKFETDTTTLIHHKNMGVGFPQETFTHPHLLETVQMLEVLIRTWQQEYIDPTATNYTKFVATKEERLIMQKHLATLKSFLFNKTLAATLENKSGATEDPSIEKVCQFINVLYQNLLAIQRIAPSLIKPAVPEDIPTTVTVMQLNFPPSFEIVSNAVKQSVETLATAFNVGATTIDYNPPTTAQAYEVVVQQANPQATPAAPVSISVGISNTNNVSIILPQAYWQLLMSGQNTPQADSICQQLSNVLPQLLNTAFFQLFLKRLLPQNTPGATLLQAYVDKSSGLTPTIHTTPLDTNLMYIMDTVLAYYHHPFVYTEIKPIANAQPTLNLGTTTLTHAPVSPWIWDLQALANQVEIMFERTRTMGAALGYRTYKNKDIQAFVLELGYLCTTNDINKLAKALKGKSLLSQTLVMQATPQSAKTNIKTNRAQYLASVYLSMKKTASENRSRHNTTFSFLVDFLHRDDLQINSANLSSSLSKAEQAYKTVHSPLHTSDKEIFFGLLSDVYTILAANDENNIPLNIMIICSYALERMNNLRDVSKNGGSKILQAVLGNQAAETFLANNFGLNKLIPFAEFVQKISTERTASLNRVPPTTSLSALTQPMTNILAISPGNASTNPVLTSGEDEDLEQTVPSPARSVPFIRPKKRK